MTKRPFGRYSLTVEAVSSSLVTQTSVSVHNGTHIFIFVMNTRTKIVYDLCLKRVRDEFLFLNLLLVFQRGCAEFLFEKNDKV